MALHKDLVDYFSQQQKSDLLSDAILNIIYGNDQSEYLPAAREVAEKQGIVEEFDKAWSLYLEKKQRGESTSKERSEKEIEQIIGGSILNAVPLKNGNNAIEKRDDYKPLTIVSAFDLNSHEYKKPDYIVDGILYPGLTILAGPPKYGKSFLSLDLACSVASGSDFLGKLTKQGEVLYLDLEGTEWRTNERLAQLGYSLCPDLLDHTYEADTVDHNLIRQLTEQIESKSNPKLMIIDTMARIKGKTRRGEDGYAAEYRFLFPLHELALKKSVAIVCVTHTRKSGAVLPDDPMELIIGSTAQYGTADNGWVLTGKREEATKILHCSGRDYEGIDLEIEFSGGKWIPQGTVEEMEQKRSEAKYDHDPTIKTIIHLVQSSGGAWRGTMQELINEVALFTGVYPAADGTRLAKSIRPYVDLLLKRNHIVTLFPSSPRNVNGKSRKEYVFRQTGFAG